MKEREPRTKIIHDYARWTVLSALRSGAPVKSRTDVYPLVDSVAFGKVLQSSTRIKPVEFDRWHKAETLKLCAREPALQVGWAAKMINIYLKTAAYVGELGRPGLRECLHPPVDSGLWKGFRKEFRGNTKILDEVCCVRRIKDIENYDQYLRVIEGCRDAARELGCRLIEVEQLWLGSATPTAKREKQ